MWIARDKDGILVFYHNKPVNGIMEITERLHSLAAYTVATQYAAQIGPQSVILTAEIPKGSLFYQNEEGEIVSEKLKVLSLNSI